MQMILDILKQKKVVSKTNISFQTTLKNYYEMGGKHFSFIFAFLPKLKEF